MKDDERKLADAILAHCKEHPQTFLYVRDLVKELGINEKRACFILEKWAEKDWYGYGVSVLGGWLTEKGEKELARE